MCLTLRNFGTWLCSCVVVLVGLLALGTCRPAFAASGPAYYWTGSCTNGGAQLDGESAVGIANTCMQAVQANDAASCTGRSECLTSFTNACQADQAVAGAPSPNQCTATENFTCNPGYNCSILTDTFPIIVVQLQPNGPPLMSKCVAGDTTVKGSAPPAAGELDQNKCYILPTQKGVCITIPGAGPLAGTTCAAYAPGVYDAGGSAGSSGTTGQNCITEGGTTACVQTTGSGAQQCGTFNGNQVCAGAIPDNTCVGYSDGSDACASTTGTTNAPSGAPTVSGGAPASPVGQETAEAPAQSGGGQNSFYYSASQVSGSASAVSSSGTGTNVGNGGSSGSGSGSGSGTGCGVTGSPCSVTNANATGDGDCSTGDCSVSGNALPTYDWSSDSWSGALTSFWAAVAAGPIGTAVSGISDNWPDVGACPSETVSISTLNITADYGTPLCNVWENSAVPVLSAVMLAVWSVTAVFIFLSA